MTTTILALDLGTTMGWALRARDQQIAHGFVSLRPQRFEGGGMRFLRFKRWLTELKGAATDIHAVYFEEVRRHAGVDAAHVYGGLMATLTSITFCRSDPATSSSDSRPDRADPLGTPAALCPGVRSANIAGPSAPVRPRNAEWSPGSR